MKRFLIGVALGWAFRSPLTTLAIECFVRARADYNAAAYQASLGSDPVPTLVEPLREVPAVPSTVERPAPGPIDPATLERLLRR